MQVSERQAKGILTPQTAGFLVDGEYPFTHALSPYTGCQFGKTTCGLYCYAQFLPQWTYRPPTLKPYIWGEAVEAKTNAAALLAAELGKEKPARRQLLRIFMSATTDPYQPIEKEREITRQLLRVFTQYKDLDLLLLQTRSPLAERDLALMANIPYLWLSITIETDDQDQLARLRGGPPLAKRFALARKAVEYGLNVQITISPCLPYTNVHDFVQRLLDTGAQRFVVDTFKAGDGSKGSRTARSGYAQLVEDWDDEERGGLLYEQLVSAGADVGWSSEGFCGIPYRNEAAAQAAEAQQAQQTAMFAMNVGSAAELIATQQVVIHFGAPSVVAAKPKRMRGYTWFWAKYVTGFDPRYHCATGLKGKYHWEQGVPVFTPSSHVMDKAPYQYIYLCGVAETRWADNLHIAMEHVPGESITDTTYTGIPIVIQNARRLHIPWVEDNWNDFPRSYTTCRNWQFGIRYYGYDGQRPAQADFTRPNLDRSKEALERAQKPPLKKSRKKKEKSDG